MRKFRDSIPETVLQNQQTSQFVDVLDQTNEYKQSLMASALRANSIGVLTDRRVILWKLSDFGIRVPEDYPMEILMQLLLNADTFCGTRGSKIGLEFFLSVLTLGKVIINDSNFYGIPHHLILGSLSNGFIAGDKGKPHFELVDDTDQITVTNTLDITIQSQYFNGNYPEESAIIRNYLNNGIIPTQLGFSPFLQLNITFQSREGFYYHNLLNKYFV